MRAERQLVACERPTQGSKFLGNILGNISINSIRRMSPVPSSSLLFSVILYSFDNEQVTRIAGHGLLRSIQGGFILIEHDGGTNFAQPIRRWKNMV